MKFDFKITTWERVEVPVEYEAKVLEAIKNGEVTCASDIWDIYDNPTLDNEFIPSEQMTIEENGGQPTIEVMDDGETIFTNN